MSPNSCWVQIGNIKSCVDKTDVSVRRFKPTGVVQNVCASIAITWDVVYLAMAVMLQSVAATAAAPTATVLGTSHTHEAAGHRQLRGLGKVG